MLSVHYTLPDDVTHLASQLSDSEVIKRLRAPAFHGIDIQAIWKTRRGATRPKFAC